MLQAHGNEITGTGFRFSPRRHLGAGLLAD
jgi:hypothetical protein